MYENSNPPDYSKFALSKNPFSILSSEGITNVEEIHVSQGIDTRLAEILSEVIDKRSSIAISIVGELGTGKTQRLKGVRKLITDSGGFVHFQKIDTNDILAISQGILNVFQNKEDAGAIEEKPGIIEAIKRFFLNPPESESTDRLVLKRETYDPQEVARKLKEGLATQDISAILLDEMENVTTASESDLIQFFESLRAFISDMPSGCIFSFACTPDFYNRVKSEFPAFIIRLHAELKCEQLTDKKAFELIKKRLSLVRIDDTIDSLFPFDESAVKLSNNIANGNPRILLRTLHSILASAARDPVIDIIDDRFVTRIVAAPNSLDEYISKVPEDLRILINAIIDKFGGGPVTYIQMSKAIKEQPTHVYADLEELTSMGMLRNKKGHYEIPGHIKDIILEE